MRCISSNAALMHGGHRHEDHDNETPKRDPVAQTKAAARDLQQKEDAAVRITVVGIGSNVGLALVKGVAGAVLAGNRVLLCHDDRSPLGVWGNSAALVADAVHRRVE